MNPTAQKKLEDNVTTADSGRSAGKTTNNPTNTEEKFLNLARNSKEAEKGGLKYALRDETIYSHLSQAGISEEGTGVKE